MHDAIKSLLPTHNIHVIKLDFTWKTSIDSGEGKFQGGKAGNLHKVSDKTYPNINDFKVIQVKAI